MIKTASIISALAISVVSLSAINTSAEATNPPHIYPEIWNDGTSRYAINVYTDSKCKDNRLILKPGYTTWGDGARYSYRVNATSWLKVVGNPNSNFKRIEANVCRVVNKDYDAWGVWAGTDPT